jgi:ADP-ribosyl-[dinitrogen reductase] hydrolase
MESINRYRGSLLGLACGDALGAPLEFSTPGTFAPLLEMTGGGPFHLPPGFWTDDTSMAMCLAESLLESRGFDPSDQLRRYVAWWRQGVWSSTGVCFDIGSTTAAALRLFEETSRPWCGSTAATSAGNGCLMRLAPVPLYFAATPELAIRRAADSSRTTHGARVCVDACRYFAGLLVGAVQGVPKAELLDPRYTPVRRLWDRDPLADEIDEVARGSFRRRSPPLICGSGYVVRCLEAALWAFFHSETFESGALKAVNLGEDADTTGAAYGQLAGSYYGEEGIPEKWLALLHRRGDIAAMAERLHAAAWPTA